MGEVELSFVGHTMLFLAFPLLGGYLATRLKAPPILGYIMGGVALRVYLGGELAAHFLSDIASIVIVLLLFVVGLEVRLTLLARFGKVLVWGGLLQIFITGTVIFLLSLIFRLSLIEAVFIGCAFAFSSTVLIAKMVQERGEEDSLIGGLTVGMLVVQGLAVIPTIILLTALAAGANLSGWGIVEEALISTAKAVLVLTIVYFLGKSVVPVVFEKVVRSSRELLNLFTVFFIFATVFLFSAAGLSSFVAAYIAGVLVGQTVRHYHIFSHMRPMRDIFTVLFITFLSASIDLSLIGPHALPAILFAVLVVAVKLTVIVGILTIFKFHSRTGFTVGLLLSQVGEFAFIILLLGLDTGIVSDHAYLFAITSTLFTILLSPLLTLNKDGMYARLRGILLRRAPSINHYVSTKIDRHPSHMTAIKLRNHVVLCGYGKVGSYVGRALQMAGVPFIAIDYDYAKVEDAKKKGINIVYGDPTTIDILEYVKCEHAAAIVSAVPEKYAQEMIVLNAKRLKKNILVFMRITREGDQRRMKDLGADVVIQPEFEAALAIVRKVLVDFKVSQVDIVRKIKRLKIEHGMM